MANHECLRYFAKLNADGEPIPGTQMGYTNNVALPCNDPCGMVELLPTPKVPAGKTNCKFPEGNRFFYRVVPYSNPLVVQANSLIMTKKYPNSPNDCWWREYLRYC